MITLSGRWIKDEFGRTVLLRGINLDGGSKMPMRPYAASHVLDGFYDHRQVSFVGRPFPLEEADEHFSRLKSWGFNFLRFLVTWEAIEHTAPGVYDEEYLDYLYRVVKKAADYGFDLYIDPHQDVWSRFTGGDGAPGWTVEAAGFDLANLHDSGVAVLHAFQGDPFPGLVWYSNYDRLATATLFSLFFGSRDFAPQTLIEGMPAQDFLQNHYFAAMRQVAERLKDLPNVIGYGTFNEPSQGMIGRELTSYKLMVPRGLSPTFWEGMKLAAGLPHVIAHFGLTWRGFGKTGSALLNPEGKSAWQAGRDVWRQNGVWDMDASGEPVLLRPEHFTEINGRKVNFYNDYFKPFANRFAAEMRSVDPDTVIFVEGIPEDEEDLEWGNGDADNIVYAPHWYDGVTMFLGNFFNWATINPHTRRPVLFSQNVRRFFSHELADIRRTAEEHIGEVPVLLGEFGTPFNMNHKRAFKTGDFSQTSRALDASYQAVEANLLHSTLWNYTSDNTNARGDQWNSEDFSIFSRDQQKGSGGQDDGGRSLDAAVRPYPRAVPGEPIKLSFDMKKRIFVFEFRHDPLLSAPAEFFLPRLQYPNGCRVEVSDGVYEVNAARQILIYTPGKEMDTHRLVVSPL